MEGDSSRLVNLPKNTPMEAQDENSTNGTFEKVKRNRRSSILKAINNSTIVGQKKRISFANNLYLQEMLADGTTRVFQEPVKDIRIESDSNISSAVCGNEDVTASVNYCEDSMELDDSVSIFNTTKFQDDEMDITLMDESEAIPSTVSTQEMCMSQLTRNESKIDAVAKINETSNVPSTPESNTNFQEVTKTKLVVNEFERIKENNNDLNELKNETIQPEKSVVLDQIMLHSPVKLIALENEQTTCPSSALNVSVASVASSHTLTQAREAIEEMLDSVEAQPDLDSNLIDRSAEVPCKDLEEVDLKAAPTKLLTATQPIISTNLADENSKQENIESSLNHEIENIEQPVVEGQLEKETIREKISDLSTPFDQITHVEPCLAEKDSIDEGEKQLPGEQHDEMNEMPPPPLNQSEVFKNQEKVESTEFTKDRTEESVSLFKAPSKADPDLSSFSVLDLPKEQARDRPLSTIKSFLVGSVNIDKKNLPFMMKGLGLKFGLQDANASTLSITDPQEGNRKCNKRKSETLEDAEDALVRDNNDDKTEAGRRSNGSTPNKLFAGELVNMTANGKVSTSPVKSFSETGIDEKICEISPARDVSFTFRNNDSNEVSELHPTATAVSKLIESSEKTADEVDEEFALNNISKPESPNVSISINTQDDVSKIETEKDQDNLTPQASIHYDTTAHQADLSKLIQKEGPMDVNNVSSNSNQTNDSIEQCRRMGVETAMESNFFGKSMMTASLHFTKEDGTLFDLTNITSGKKSEDSFAKFLANEDSSSKNELESEENTGVSTNNKSKLTRKPDTEDNNSNERPSDTTLFGKSFLIDSPQLASNEDINLSPAKRLSEEKIAEDSFRKFLASEESMLSDDKEDRESEVISPFNVQTFESPANESVFQYMDKEASMLELSSFEETGGPSPLQSTFMCHRHSLTFAGDLVNEFDSECEASISPNDLSAFIDNAIATPKKPVPKISSINQKLWPYIEDVNDECTCMKFMRGTFMVEIKFDEYDDEKDDGLIQEIVIICFAEKLLKQQGFIPISDHKLYCLTEKDTKLLAIFKKIVSLHFSSLKDNLINTRVTFNQLFMKVYKMFEKTDALICELYHLTALHEWRILGAVHNIFEIALEIIGLRYNMFVVLCLDIANYPNKPIKVNFGVHKADLKRYPFHLLNKTIKSVEPGSYSYLHNLVYTTKKFLRDFARKHSRKSLRLSIHPGRTMILP